MVQFARPDADTFIGNYVDEVGGTTDIFNSIDEVVPADADFIESPLDPASEVYVCHLSNITDPLDDTGHTVRYRLAKDPSGAEQVDVTVELREGYVNEATQGTLIASTVFLNIANGTADDDEELLELILTTVEADSITDYADLAVRVVADEC